MSATTQNQLSMATTARRYALLSVGAAIVTSALTEPAEDAVS